MPKYLVTIKRTYGAKIEVEAESDHEAGVKAEQKLSKEGLPEWATSCKQIVEQVEPL